MSSIPVLPFTLLENCQLFQKKFPNGGKMFFQIDENNARQGGFIFLDADGKKQAEGSFKNNLLEGKFIEFYPSGQKRAIYFFHKDVRVGQFSEFYENGQLKLKGELNTEEKKTGEWLHYNEDGTLREKNIYKNDMLNGDSLIYENGFLVAKVPYVNDKIEGLYLEYYPNGILKSESIYRNNKLHGPNVDYYPNGEKMLVNRYENNEAIGAYTYYEEDGYYEKGILDESGAPNGLLTYYGPDNLPRAEYSYKHGVLEGRTTYYWADGTKKLSIIYRDGKAITKGTMIYVPDGSILAHNGKKYEQVWPKKLPPLLSAVKERQR